MDTLAMKIALLTTMLVLTVLIPALPVLAGDYYIRSRYPDGGFTGSHEILTQPKPGYHSTDYCGERFWVSATTVAWTEEEVAAGRLLVLEQEGDGARSVVCSSADEFARLEDLGLSQREIDRLRAPNEPFRAQANRLHTIRDAFKQFKQ